LIFCEHYPSTIPSLKSDLVLICNREYTRSIQFHQSEENAGAVRSDLYGVSTNLYEEIADKVMNTRYREILKNYSEMKALKGKGNFSLQGTLLASNMLGSGKGNAANSRSATSNPSVSTSGSTHCHDR